MRFFKAHTAPSREAWVSCGSFLSIAGVVSFVVLFCCLFRESMFHFCFPFRGRRGANCVSGYFPLKGFPWFRCTLCIPVEASASLKLDVRLLYFLIFYPCVFSIRRFPTLDVPCAFPCVHLVYPCVTARMCYWNFAVCFFCVCSFVVFVCFFLGVLKFCCCFLWSLCIGFFSDFLCVSVLVRFLGW